MPTYKLTYFDVRARAETSRLLFALKGQEFIDRRIDFEQWSSLKQEAPMGQVPYLEIDSKQLAQSGAIARYLAKEFGFMGQTTFEAAQIDSIVELVNDLYDGVRVIVVKKKFNQPEKAAVMLTEFREKYPAVLKNLETYLNANNNGNGFFIGSQISVADVHLFNMIDIITDQEEYKGFIDDYPSLTNLMQRIKAQPNIKSYLETRKQTPM